MQPRDKRDLPEVVAEILIEQHAMREDIAALRREMKEEISGLRGEIGGLRHEVKEEIGGLRQEVREGLAELAQTFNGMTNAILDAMNRGTDRYERTGQEIDQLKTRVAKLENPAAGAA